MPKNLFMRYLNYLKKNIKDIVLPLNKAFVKTEAWYTEYDSTYNNILFSDYYMNSESYLSNSTPNILVPTLKYL